MKTLCFFVVVMCALPLHSNAQSVILSKEESAKYLQVVNYAFNKMSKDSVKYWKEGHNTYVTNVKVINNQKVSFSVEKEAKKPDGSAISRISFCITNSKKSQKSSEEIIFFTISSKAETGYIVWFVRDSEKNRLEPTVHNDILHKERGTDPVATINWYIDHLDDYLQ